MKQHRTRILHLDDDRGFLELFRATYCEEFDVLSLTAGTDILAVLERETIDALVLDYELPDRNGLQVLQQVRSRYPTLPIVFYTGQGNEEIARQAFQSGATDYFVKEAADFAQKEKVINSVQKAVEKCAIEAELEEKQALLESIIEYNPYSIQIFDHEGHPVRMNRAHTKIFGVTSTFGGDIVFDDELAIPEEVREAICHEWRSAIPSYIIFNDSSGAKADPTGELMPRWRNGDVVKFPPIWYSIPFPVSGSVMKPKCVGTTGFSVRDSHGRITQYVFMHEDITARMEAEEEARNASEALRKTCQRLQEECESIEQKVEERTDELVRMNRKLDDTIWQLACANEKLENKNRQLADMNEQLHCEIEGRERLQQELEKKNDELKDFAHRVSHDLRSNLLVMQRLVEVGGLSPGEVRQNAERLIDTTIYLRGFTERLLTLAQAGRIIDEKLLTAPDRTAQEAFARLSPSCPDARLLITPSFPEVLCDPCALDTVLTNLFSNALAHSKSDEPLIEMTYSLEKGFIEIAVSDNGTGIAPGAFPHLFDAAWTACRESRFGFGLAIVRKIVEAHGGRVRAQNRASGSGAVFIFSLPHEKGNKGCTCEDQVDDRGAGGR